MATYQDGRISQKTLNAFLARPNPHDWIGKKPEINGCMCWMCKLCKAIFCPTQICGKILCMFLLKILKTRKPDTLYVKPRLLAVINLNI